MKTEKIYRPSELKDGDRVNFAWSENDSENVIEFNNAIVSIPNNKLFAFDIGSELIVDFCAKKRDLFKKDILHVERIVEEEKPKRLTLIDFEYAMIPYRLRKDYEKSIEDGTKSTCSQPTVDNTTTPPNSNRIEKYDLISKEETDHINEIAKTLKKIQKQLKKLGIKL